MAQEETNTESLDSILAQFTTIVDSLSLFKMQLSTVQQQIRSIEKTVKKELKSVAKIKHREQNKKKREPCGFAKPTLVTKELCEFMNKPEGTKIARTAVTKALCSYIKENGLEDSTNQGIKGDRRINPDHKLKSLLGLTGGDSDTVTYFNIQKYMNKHFIKDSNQYNHET